MKLPLEKRKMKVVELDEFEDIVLDADEFFDPDEEMSDDGKKALKDLEDFGFMENGN